MRSGKFIKQLHGEMEYLAFAPNALPFKLKRDAELEALLAEANLALGRLDGVAEIVPDIDFLTLMYSRKEATYSSQVEGTQATFADVLKVEAEAGDQKVPYDVKEILNYIKAMNYGLGRLESLPLSLRLIREIHKVLLGGVRGEEKQSGEFRRSQNWIGGPTINTASFVPAPADDLIDLLSNLESFFYDKKPIPVLIKAGLIHSQFENIHPFLDGNGRTGRLLITFYLCQQRVLQKPLLYLSVYFKNHQKEYYLWLDRAHEKDDIEGWLKFFLSGVIETSREAFRTAQKILELRNKDNQKIVTLGRTTPKASKVLDNLYKNPFITLKGITEFTGLSRSNAYYLLKKLEGIGILHQLFSNRGQAKVFLHQEYLSLFSVLK